MKKENAEALIKVALFFGIMVFAFGDHTLTMALFGYFLCFPAFLMLKLK